MTIQAINTLSPALRRLTRDPNFIAEVDEAVSGMKRLVTAHDSPYRDLLLAELGGTLRKDTKKQLQHSRAVTEEVEKQGAKDDWLGVFLQGGEDVFAHWAGAVEETADSLWHNIRSSVPQYFSPA